MQYLRATPTGSTQESTQTTFSLLERPLPKSRYDASLSCMSFLFSEMVKYSLQQVNQCDQLEARLHEMGTRIGVRLLELFFNREKSVRRLTRLLPLLTFLSQVCWRSLFGHPAELLRGQDHENEYMINDKNLILTRFIQIPKDLGSISCAAYVAGIVEGFLCSADFPAETTAHDIQQDHTTTILIRFLPQVMEREKRMGKSN